MIAFSDPANNRTAPERVRVRLYPSTPATPSPTIPPPRLRTTAVSFSSSSKPTHRTKRSVSLHPTKKPLSPPARCKPGRHLCNEAGEAHGICRYPGAGGFSDASSSLCPVPLSTGWIRINKREGSAEVQTAISKTPVRQLSDERFKLRRPSDEPPQHGFYRGRSQVWLF